MGAGVQTVALGMAADQPMKTGVLYDYQQDMVSRLHEAWQSRRSVMLQMPTGTGKTHVLAAVVRDFLIGRGGTVWIVAHRRELVAQIEETVGRFGIDVEEGRVRVMSVQWLSRHWADVTDRPELVVVDEAHHAVAETYRVLWDQCPAAKFLGLTATPCRMNRSGFTDLFDTLITSWSIAEFIEKGYLSLFDYVSIRKGSEEQRLIDSLEKRGADGDYQVKEMNRMLNRDETVGRLYRSMERFAGGRRGIVYAISIDHARRIADYFCRQGVTAVPIDSKTPMAERKRLVERFKSGRIRVLVNVDIFSEGFDCPDVEFIQLARPTLSLAKYLQQVGRGLRKAKGKETCVLIDSVGLYRVFGLPVTRRDWPAMFEGRTAGKGDCIRCNSVANRGDAGLVTTGDRAAEESDLEMVVRHEYLLEQLQNGSLPSANGATDNGLRAFRDRDSGLYGLRRGERTTVTPSYVRVYDVTDNLATVRFEDQRTGLVDGEGNIRMLWNRHAGLRLTENGILVITDGNTGKRYVDLTNGMEYESAPKSVRFGDVELLLVDNKYYGRIKHPYKSGYAKDRCILRDRGFYLDICMYPDAEWIDIRDGVDGSGTKNNTCILTTDSENWYFISSWLHDGSIIISDQAKNYYHAEAGRTKRYIGNEQTEAATTALAAVMTGLRDRAKKKERRLQTEALRKRLSQLRDAEPFRSGDKWGLKHGGKVIVPPIYRNIRTPVGDYCAVEKSPQQWGIIQLDGKVIVDTCYQDVAITQNGTANLTVFPGKTKTVKLRK